jgi:tetratricopeptide (TPR) repeat protein
VRIPARLVVFAVVSCLLASGSAAGQPSSGAPGSCFRSEAFDRARARFAAQMEKGDWETAIADVVAAKGQWPAGSALRALYAVQHARAAQQRSSHSHADGDGVEALVREAEGPVAAANDPCLASDLRSLRAEIHYAQAFDRIVTWDQVRRELDAVLRGLEPLGDDGRLTWALFYRGLVDQQQEVGDLGEQFFERAGAIAERRGDAYRLSYVERHLAAIDDTRGDLAGAEARFRRSLALREKVGALLFIPPAQTALADLLQKRAPRNPEIARLYADAAARAAAAKANRLASSAHAAISSRLAAAGDRDGAVRHAEQALAFAQAHGSASLVADARQTLDRLRPGR